MSHDENIGCNILSPLPSRQILSSHNPCSQLIDTTENSKKNKKIEKEENKKKKIVFRLKHVVETIELLTDDEKIHERNDNETLFVHNNLLISDKDSIMFSAKDDPLVIALKFFKSFITALEVTTVYFILYLLMPVSWFIAILTTYPISIILFCDIAIDATLGLLPTHCYKLLKILNDTWDHYSNHTTLTLNQLKELDLDVSLLLQCSVGYVANKSGMHPYLLVTPLFRKYLINLDLVGAYHHVMDLYKSTDKDKVINYIKIWGHCFSETKIGTIAIDQYNRFMGTAHLNSVMTSEMNEFFKFERNAKLVNPFKISDPAVVELLARKGIPTLSGSTMMHTHPANKALEMSILINNVLPVLGEDSTIYSCKPSKLGTLKAKAIHEYPVLTGKDYFRYYGNKTTKSANPCETEVAFFHDVLPYLTPTDIAHFFSISPKLDKLICTAVIPPETTYLGDSEFPDLYQLIYDRDDVVWIPEGDKSSSYRQPLRAREWLDIPMIEAPGLNPSISCSLICTKYSHHVFMFTRNEYLLESTRDYDCGDYIFVEPEMMPFSKLRDRRASRWLTNELVFYAERVDDLTYTNLFAKAKSLTMNSKGRALQPNEISNSVLLAAYSYNLNIVGGIIGRFQAWFYWFRTLTLIPFYTLKESIEYTKLSVARKSFNKPIHMISLDCRPYVVPPYSPISPWLSGIYPNYNKRWYEPHPNDSILRKLRRLSGLIPFFAAPKVLFGFIVRKMIHSIPEFTEIITEWTKATHINFESGAYLIVTTYLTYRMGWLPLGNISQITFQHSNSIWLHTTGGMAFTPLNTLETFIGQILFLKADIPPMMEFLAVSPYHIFVIFISLCTIFPGKFNEKYSALELPGNINSWLQNDIEEDYLLIFMIILLCVILVLLVLSYLIYNYFKDTSSITLPDEESGDDHTGSLGKMENSVKKMSIKFLNSVQNNLDSLSKGFDRFIKPADITCMPWYNHVYTIKEAELNAQMSENNSINGIRSNSNVFINPNDIPYTQFHDCNDIPYTDGSETCYWDTTAQLLNTDPRNIWNAVQSRCKSHLNGQHGLDGACGKAIVKISSMRSGEVTPNQMFAIWDLLGIHAHIIGNDWVKMHHNSCSLKDCDGTQPLIYYYNNNHVSAFPETQQEQPRLNENEYDIDISPKITFTAKQHLGKYQDNLRSLGLTAKLPNSDLHSQEIDYNIDFSSAEKLVRDLINHPNLAAPVPSGINQGELLINLKSMAKHAKNDPNILKTRKIKLYIGLAGSGKTTKVLSDLNITEDHELNAQLRWIVPNIHLRNDIVMKKPFSELHSHVVPTLFQAIYSSRAQYIIIDDLRQFPPGFLDLIMLLMPQEATFVCTGDPTQGAYKMPVEDSYVNDLPNTLDIITPSLSNYATITHRLAKGVATSLGLCTTSGQTGGFILIDKLPNNLIILTSNPRYANLLQQSGRDAISMNQSQGLTIDDDYVVSISSNDTGITDEIAYVALTRGKKNVLIHLQGYNSEFNSPAFSSMILNGLISDLATRSDHIISSKKHKAINTEGNFTAIATIRHILTKVGKMIPSDSSTELLNPNSVGSSFIKVNDDMNKKTDIASDYDYIGVHPEHEPKIFAARPNYLEPTSLMHWEENVDKYERELVSNRSGMTTNQIRETGTDHDIFLVHQIKDEATTDVSLDKRIKSTDSLTIERNIKKSFNRFVKLRQAFLRVVPQLSKKIPFDPDYFESCKIAGYNTWSRGRTVKNISRAVDQSPYDWEENYTKLMLKNQTIKKIETIGGNAKPGQIVTTFPLNRTFKHAPYATYLEYKLFQMLPDSIYLHCRKSPAMMSDWYEEHWDKDSNVTMNDYKGFDTGMDEAFMLFNKWLLEQFDFPDDFIKEWYEQKLNTQSFKGQMPIMQFSGDRWTWLFNTINNIAFTYLKYTIKPNRPQGYSGDDSIVCGNLKVRREFVPTEWKLISKISTGKTGTFCGYLFGSEKLTLDYTQLLARARIAYAMNSGPDTILNYYDLLSQCNLTDSQTDQDWYSAAYFILGKCANRILQNYEKNIKTPRGALYANLSYQTLIQRLRQYYDKTTMFQHALPHHIARAPMLKH